MSDDIRIAVSAILLVGDELLVIKRANSLRTFGGFHAFPGGQIDPEDRDPALAASPYPDLAQEEWHALRRELIEEISLDIGDPASQVQRLYRIGHALTPKVVSSRFDTRFCVVELPDKPDLQADPGEIDHYEWLNIEQIFSKYHSGQILLAPPTLKLLNWVQTGGLKPANEDFVPHVPKGHLFCMQSMYGLRTIPVPSNTLPPATTTNCWLLGDKPEQRYLIDPSPKDERWLKALLDTVEGIGFSHIFLTHHHPDHCERAADIARQFKVPMVMSQPTANLLGADYLEGFTVQIVGEGDVLTQWLGKSVKVYAVPGHASGQLSLAPESMEWFIAGDLYQGIGTVVIAEPDGDMAQYMTSLQRVIDLDPAFIIPSHGGFSGGTGRIQQVLAHRQQREADIAALLEQGLDVPAICAELYQDVDKRLWPLAEMNIRMHVTKLGVEA